jgi:hypothetical protein
MGANNKSSSLPPAEAKDDTDTQRYVCLIHSQRHNVVDFHKSSVQVPLILIQKAHLCALVAEFARIQGAT